MLKEVESKIQELREQQKDEYYKQKTMDLENWGLTKNKSKKGEFPLVITDEEYEALIEASAGTAESGRNFTATLLNFGAVGLLALGVVIGIACVILFDDMGFILLSSVIVLSMAVALIMRGLAVAIGLLQQNNDLRRAEVYKKLRDKKRVVFPEKQPEVDTQFKNAPPAPVSYVTDPKTVEMPK